MTNLQEKWLPIVGYELLYQVSNLGRVRSINRIIYKKNGQQQHFKSNLLKPSVGGGYSRVTLCKNFINKTFSVHRLLGIAFIPNPNNKLELNHIDGNKLNNHIYNLEWCSRSENALHAFKTGLLFSTLKGKCGELHPTSKLSNASVFNIKRLIERRETNVKIASMFRISEKAISDIKIGRTWRHIL